MGTRADFYVGRGPQAQWLGSIAWDGYPSGIPNDILKATGEQEYRDAVVFFLAHRDDSTFPEQGWPWPWKDSGTTDYAYAFDDGQVWAACFGHKWFLATEENKDEFYEGKESGGSDAEECVFPDMTSVQNITFGKRSGIIVLRAK